MKTLIVFGVLLVALTYVMAGGDSTTEYVIPKALEEEGKKIKEKIESLNLPKTADGKWPDICKIPDAANKKMVFDFIDKVNAAGGKIPKPNC